MNIGLFMMPLHPPGRLHADTYDEDLELLAFADDLGYSEAWIGEHFLLPWENMPGPDLFIARALGVTKQMRLGTGVVLLHFHNPVLLAHRIAMLDHLARGRFFFGIGAGGSASDIEIFGLDTEAGSPRQRMTECIDLIVRLWEEGPFDYQGKFFSVARPEDRSNMELGFHMRPYQQPHPPIAVAGASVRSETLELAGERGWWPLSSGFVHASQLADNWSMVEKGASKSGKDASRSQWRLAREVHVADTSRKAREEVLNGPIGRNFVDYWLKLIGNGPRGLGMFKYDPELPDEAVTPEYMLDNYWIVGDPDECAEKIRSLHQQSGGFGTVLMQTFDWGRDTNKSYRSIELMAKEVLPSLQDLTP